MNKSFGSTLSNQSFTTPVVGDQSTDKVLHNRFEFYSAFLRSYVEYSQKVENLPKFEMQHRVNKLTNKLVEKHRFGAKFVNDINKFINDSYTKNRFDVFNCMKADANLDEGVFESMMEDMLESELMSDVSPRFKMMLH